MVVRRSCRHRGPGTAKLQRHAPIQASRQVATAELETVKFFKTHQVPKERVAVYAAKRSKSGATTKLKSMHLWKSQDVKMLINPVPFNCAGRLRSNEPRLILAEI